jgi:hypothetical protein
MSCSGLYVFQNIPLSDNTGMVYTIYQDSLPNFATTEKVSLKVTLRERMTWKKSPHTLPAIRIHIAAW